MYGIYYNGYLIVLLYYALKLNCMEFNIFLILDFI